MTLRTRLGLAASAAVLASVGLALGASALVTARSVRTDLERELLDRAAEITRPRPLDDPRPPDGGGPFGRGPERRPPRFDGLGPRFLERGDTPYDPSAARAATDTPRLTEVAAEDGSALLVATVRRPMGVFQDARSLDGLARVLAAQRATAIGLGIPLALIAGFAGFGLAALLIRPVARMTLAAERLRLDADAAEPMPEGSDEVGRLGAALNAMARRSRAAYAEVAASLELQRRFTGDAAHELRTPLARIRMATSGALAQARGEAEMREALADADAEAERMGRLVRALLLLARVEGGAGEARVFDLREAAPPEIAADLPTEPVPVRGDPDLVARAVANLAENARRHTPPETAVRFSLLVEEGWAVARIADDGPGIAPEHLPNLGRRFYRPDAARGGEGTGLGLAIARSVAERFGGSLEIASSPAGTIATLRLPLVSEGGK